MRRPGPERLLPITAAVAFAVIGTVEITLDPGFRAHPLAPALGCAVAVAGALLAVVAPVAGTWVVAAMFPVTTAAGLDGPTGVGVLAFFLAPGWAGYRRPPRRSWTAPLGAQLLASVGVLLVGPAANLSVAWENLFFAALCWVSWGVGLVARRLRERSVQLAALAAALDAEREGRERAVVHAERQRIAREVHDSVAHTVSVMVLQLGALRTTVDADGTVARTLAGVEGLGRSAVQEMRGLVGLLRDDEQQEPAAVPSLDRIEELITQVRATGLPVTLARTGDPVPLPRALDVSAFRVVQEALTNVLRHAGAGAVASVLVHRDARAVRVEICDRDGRPAPAAGSAVGGHGLVAMRERVAVYGGTLDAGPRDGGGFTVRACFPLTGRGA